jgi:dihydropteroate synthase
MAILNISGRAIDLAQPRIMGILNITPDSFFSNSRVQTLDSVYKKAEKMIAEGATFLDIGGYSTRPNATDIPESEELARVLPVIEMLAKRFNEIILSIDTFRASVAREAVMAGAQAINDISGSNLDDTMLDTVAQLGVPYIMMHSRGNPQTMQQLAHYQDLILEIIQELQPKIYYLRQRGLKDIIIDPGFGFAKTITHNFELMAKFEALQVLNCPILIGISRKSFIWKTLQTTADNALNGTTAMNAIALSKGASILRVHDVAEAMEVVTLCQNLYSK